MLTRTVQHQPMFSQFFLTKNGFFCCWKMSILYSVANKIWMLFQACMNKRRPPLHSLSCEVKNLQTEARKETTAVCWTVSENVRKYLELLLPSHSEEDAHRHPHPPQGQVHALTHNQSRYLLLLPSICYCFHRHVQYE